MYIGKIVNIDLDNLQIFEKVYTLKKGTIFLARDGVLHNQIKADFVKILKHVKSRKDTDLREYVEVQNYENKNFIKKELDKEENNIETAKKEIPKNTNRK